MTGSSFDADPGGVEELSAAIRSMTTALSRVGPAPAPRTGSPPLDSAVADFWLAIAAALSQVGNALSGSVAVAGDRRRGAGSDRPAER